jgi:acyl carrier protein
MSQDKLSDVLRDHMPDAPAQGALDPEANLVDLGIDSLRLVELIISLEDSFDMLIPDEEMLAENFRTVGTIAALVDRLAASV